jgi:hypothetical protein
VADLPFTGGFTEVSAAVSLVESSVAGSLETLFVGRASVIALSSTSFGFFAGLPVPIFVYIFS